MIILCCGSRTFTDYDRIYDTLWFYREEYDKVLINGGARGADQLSEKAGIELNFDVKTINADWDKYGKKAGYIRNQLMIDMNPNLVIAFWDGESKGTQHTIKMAKAKKIDTLIIYV